MNDYQYRNISLHPKDPSNKITSKNCESRSRNFLTDSLLGYAIFADLSFLENSDNEYVYSVKNIDNGSIEISINPEKIESTKRTAFSHKNLLLDRLINYPKNYVTTQTWKQGYPWWLKSKVENGGKWWAEGRLISVDGKPVEESKG